MEQRRHTRVRSGIRLDREGRFWHDGQAVLHPAIVRAFQRGLERSPDGRYLIRLGNDWAYVAVEDAPYVVSRALLHAAGVTLRLSDGREEPLDPSTLARSVDGVLYCRVGIVHRARFARQAQADLGEILEVDEHGRFAVAIAGRRWPIGDDAGGPPPRPEDGPAPVDDGPPGP